MAERFDVVVVGARCAGAPLATMLARRGLRVCVVDRARFPSEVPSTHGIQPSGVAALDRLGLVDRIAATGAPPIDRGSMVLDDVTIDFDQADLVELLGAPMYCVRRITLDALLMEAAAEAGADVRTETAVEGLIETDGALQGVETAGGSILAPLVVGADGPHSTVARLVGAREYHATPPERFFLWGYFEGVDKTAGRIRLGKIGDLAMLSAPTDAGLFMAAVAPSVERKNNYLADTAAGLAGGIAHFEELADVLAGARRVGPVRVMSRWHGYFREACGPGWVLVGDAGHFKDPTPGQGISDALRQAEMLAPAIEAELGDSRHASCIREWARWRDDDAWEMYWFAADMGAAGPTPALVRDMFRDLNRRSGGTENLLRILNHDLPPSKVFTAARAGRSLVSLARTRPRQLRQLASEAGQLVAEEGRRRRQRRHPILAPTGAPALAADPVS